MMISFFLRRQRASAGHGAIILTPGRNVIFRPRFIPSHSSKTQRGSLNGPNSLKFSPIKTRSPMITICAVIYALTSARRAAHIMKWINAGAWKRSKGRSITASSSLPRSGNCIIRVGQSLRALRVLKARAFIPPAGTTALIWQVRASALLVMRPARFNSFLKLRKPRGRSQSINAAPIG